MGEIETGAADRIELPEELVITLRQPVKLGDAEYASLTLREPTAAQWLLWSKLSGVEGDIKAVSVVAGVPEGAVRLIGARDLLEAARYIGAFLS